MKSVIPYFISFILFFAGCSPISHFVNARFETIDTNTDSLRIHFRFTRDNDSTFPVGAIEVWKRGSRICVTYSDSIPIVDYTFPDVPQGFVRGFNEGFDSLYHFSKNEEYYFRFRGFNEFVAGYWSYFPQFAQPNHRWLFDSLGNYKDHIRVSYDTWIGSDVIYLDFAEPVRASQSDIVVRDSKNTVVPYTFYAEATPGKLFTLELERDLEGDEQFTLYFSPSIFNVQQDSLMTLQFRADDGRSVALSGPRFSNLRR